MSVASAENTQLIKKLRETKAVAGETVEENRRLFDAGAAAFIVPENISRETVDADGVPCEWFRVANAAKGAVLYLHGGGFVIGSTISHAPLIARIVEASGYHVLGVNFRLAPEHPFPAPLNDCVRSYSYLLGRGFAPQNIAIVGDSAGGALVISTLLSIRDQGLPLPACGVTLSAWADLTLTADSLQRNAERDPVVTKDILQFMTALYAAGQDPSNPLISPALADLSGLPPLLLQAGDRDVCEDDSRKLADNARAAGVDVQFEFWPEMIHCWHTYYDVLPEARDAVSKVGSYLRAHLS